MCGCGRKRAEGATTSVQAEQERLAALKQLEDNAVREAEMYAQSAANAVRNSSSN